jgi:hypothetical protein
MGLTRAYVLKRNQSDFSSYRKRKNSEMVIALAVTLMVWLKARFLTV